MYEGCTRNAWHLYMFRYQADAFAKLPRDRFLQALNAEGIPSGGGYTPVPWDTFLKESFATRGARRVFSEDALDRWPERCRVPEHQKVCREAVWFTQNMLIGPRGDMDQIAEAIRKIHAHAGALLKS